MISALSFFILILSIYLLLQKNTKKLQDLLLLGYSPSEVASQYVKMVVWVNVAVYVFGIALMLYARSLYMPQLEAFAIYGGSLWQAALSGFVLIALITMGNIIAIKRKVAALWYLEK